MRFFLIYFCLQQCVFALGLANGVKIGEVSHDSAIIWSRLTAKAKPEPLNATLAGAVPGQKGELMLSYWKKGIKNKAIQSAWVPVREAHDFSHSFSISSLSPNTHYAFTIFGRQNKGGEETSIMGSFQTAPQPEADQPITFTVSTCQRFQERDDAKNGHIIYRSMLAQQPDFFIQTGDAVYYDKVPLAKDLASARFKWNRIYALPHFREFHRQIPSYWLKDDHDTLKNDAWPGQSYGSLTWEQGLQVWREQVPMSPLPYRTFRWGKHLQIWLPEGREYRSPNTMPDGPEKTILGTKQWQWLTQSMRHSDATYRILVSATPVVGPDRGNKNDNHANTGFQHEGDKLRNFLASLPGCFVVNGDRHWQYHSTDPKTGLKEFGCGPASNAHAQGFSKKQSTPWQSFLRVKGGYLSVRIGSGPNPDASVKHHDVHGKVVHEVTLQR